MKHNVKPIRCPVCKSIKVYLTEWIKCYATWYPGDEEGYNKDGNYYKVDGTCEVCDYVWTLRGYCQMNDELKEKLAINYKLLQLEKDLDKMK